MRLRCGKISGLEGFFDTMTDDQTVSEPSARQALRAAVLVDRSGLKDYPASLQHLFVALADESYPNMLICSPRANAESILAPSTEFTGYPVFKIPLFLRQNRRLLIDSLEKFKPTVLHCFGRSKAHLARYLSREMDVPYVLTFTSPVRKFSRPLVSNDRCATLIASSETIADSLSRCYPRLIGRIRQINIGTFAEDSCACFSSANRIASLVLAQPLDNHLDFEAILNAVKHLVLDGYEFVMAMVGTGPAKKAVYETIKTLGLSQVVTVVPEIHPMRSVFVGTDILIVPRLRAEFNPSLLEAMSVGTAVASCQGSVDDLLEDGKTSVCFDPHDELSVYTCLQKLLSKHEFARQIAQAGQDYVRQHHSVSAMTNRLLRAYLDAQRWYKESHI